MIGLSRRKVLGIGAGAIACGGLGWRVEANEEAERHGMSAFGDLKYPQDFAHYDYVDPVAPKGGMFSQIGPNTQFNQNSLTFNSLNSYILRGDAAQGIELTFAALMVRAQDEPDAMYGLAARAVRISADGTGYRFALRPEARFHDGSRLTAHDVAFSLTVLKDKGHPIITQLLRDFAGAEALDDATVVLRFAPTRARDVPLFAVSLPIFSRAYYSSRKFDETTLDIPLGSGPYGVSRVEPGRYIEYKRVPDWWGANLPVARGQYNFDTLRFEYYRDRDVGFEGFTAKSYLFREEFTSRIWATRYDFPAIKDGRVKREVLPDQTPSGAQGWFINMRRAKFQNPKLREALIYAFDFEWTNKSIMYSSYDRTHSVFQNSQMMAEGKPAPMSLRCSNRSAARCPTRCSASRSCRPCPTAPARIARCSGAADNCCRRRATSSRTASGCRPRARFFRSNFYSMSRHSSPIMRHTSRTWRRSASMPRFAWSIQYRCRPAATTSTTISPSSASASPQRRGIHCGPTSRRKQRPSRAPRISPASPILRSMP